MGTEIQNLLQQHLWELVYLGAVTTALANWIQTKAQRSIRAERASIIYSMDPVYGAFFSYLLLGETLNGITGWIGASLIVVAAATNAMFDVTEKDPRK
jgi:drug/metabolite transporter (DMT)-like permease